MLLCICDACRWTWRDMRPAAVRVRNGCARCGEPWGRRYRAWDGRDARTRRRVPPVADVWLMLPAREREPRSA